MSLLQELDQLWYKVGWTMTFIFMGITLWYFGRFFFELIKRPFSDKPIFPVILDPHTEKGSDNIFVLFLFFFIAVCIIVFIVRSAPDSDYPASCKYEYSPGC